MYILYYRRWSKQSDTSGVSRYHHKIKKQKSDDCISGDVNVD